MVKTEQGEASESPKELDVGLQRVDTDQVMEYHLDNRKDEERVEEEEEEEKNTPETKRSRWIRTWTAPWSSSWSWSWMRMWSWPWRRGWMSPKPRPWARMWSAPRDTWTGGTSQGRHVEESLIPWPDRDLEGADSDSRTKAEGPNIKAGTKHRLGGGGSHVCQKTQYGSEELLGMNTKVSCVEGTPGGKQQEIQALADSGASCSIISRDLATTLNIHIYEKGEATLKDGSYNHMDESGRGEVVMKEKDGWPLKIDVMVSNGLGEGELVVGLEELKELHILYKEFPRTLHEFRRSKAEQAQSVQYYEGRQMV